MEKYIGTYFALRTLPDRKIAAWSGTGCLLAARARPTPSLQATSAQFMPQLLDCTNLTTSAAKHNIPPPSFPPQRTPTLQRGGHTHTDPLPPSVQGVFPFPH